MVQMEPGINNPVANDRGTEGRHAGFIPVSSQIECRCKRTLSYWIPAFAGMTSTPQATRSIDRHSRECRSLVKLLDSRIRGNDDTLQAVGIKSPGN